MSSMLGAENVLATVLTPASGKRDELLQTLRSLRTAVEQDPGCVLCAVCQFDDAGDQLLFLSEWETPDDLERHMASEHFCVLAGASRLLGSSADFRVISSKDRDRRLP